MVASSLFVGSSLLRGVDAPEEPIPADALSITSLSFSVSPAKVYLGETVLFQASAASDNPSATLTFTIYYDYLLPDSVVNPASPVSVNSTGSPGYVNITYLYDHVGNLSDSEGTYFYARLVVNDGSKTSSSIVKVYVMVNTAPAVKRSFSSEIPATSGETVNLSYRVRDLDNDSVTVTWDFGDGTSPVVNETGPAGTELYVNQTHAWVIPYEPGRGDYFVYFPLSVSFLDSVGNIAWSNATAKIWVPYNIEPDFIFTSSSSYASPGGEVTFIASATDPEGDPITWTFVFNNSLTDYLTIVEHTDPTAENETVWMNVTESFPEIGNYTITLYLSDALPPYQTEYHNLSDSVQIRVAVNNAPGVLANITMSPLTPKLNSTVGYVTVSFSTQVYDSDGDVLTLDWDFGDGSVAGNVSGGGTGVYSFTQLHDFTAAGLFNVTLIVDDGHGHQVLRYKLVSIASDNKPPRFVSLNLSLSNVVFAVPGSTTTFSIVVYDEERNPITAWFDFGDNTSLVRVDASDFSDNNTVVCSASHIFNTSGTYDVIISFTDNEYGVTHNVSITATIDVKAARVVTVRIWDWWDYTSLGMVFAVVGVVVGRWYLLSLFRKRLDGKGMTYEEYLVVKKELREAYRKSVLRIDESVQAKQMTAAAAKAKKMELRKKLESDLQVLRAPRMDQPVKGV